MLVKYFNHFPEEELRTEILRAINTISPTAQQVHGAQPRRLRRPQAERGGETHCRRSPGGGGAIFRSEGGAAPRGCRACRRRHSRRCCRPAARRCSTSPRRPSPLRRWACYLCVYTLKAKNPQANYVLETLQKAERADGLLLPAVPLRNSRVGCASPRACSASCSSARTSDAETEALVGDFLKKIVVRGEERLPPPAQRVLRDHLRAPGHGVREDPQELHLPAGHHEQGSAPRHGARHAAGEVRHPLGARRRAGLLQGGRFTRAARPRSRRCARCSQRAPEGGSEPVRGLHSPVRPEGKKGQDSPSSRRSPGSTSNRPFFLRRLNRLIRVAGALEIKTTSKKIQEILDFARAERIQFLEETSVVTLCQLLTRSIIEQSREYFKEPSRNMRSLNGYIRGARFIPAKILMGPLIHIAQHPALDPQSRALVVETLENMDPCRAVQAKTPHLPRCRNPASPPEDAGPRRCR